MLGREDLEVVAKAKVGKMAKERDSKEIPRAYRKDSKEPASKQEKAIHTQDMLQLWQDWSPGQRLLEHSGS